MRLWVLFGVLSAYQAYDLEDTGMIMTQEVCAGKDYVFPFAEFMSTRKVLFTPKSSPGSARLVMDEGTSLDPRFSKVRNILSIPYKVKLLDASKDYEGKYSIFWPGRTNRTSNLLTLTVKDCSLKRKIDYGRSFSIEVSRSVEQIDYSPFDDSKMTVILWSRYKSIARPRGTLENGSFVVKKPTYTDQGVYTLRDTNGSLLLRYHITVEEVHQDRMHKSGDDFTLSFPVDTVRYNLIYQPNHEGGRPVTLIQNGYLRDSGRFEGRIELLSTGVEIMDLKVLDGGTFKLLDNAGNLALVMELTVRTRTLADQLPSTENSTGSEASASEPWTHVLTDYGINYTVLMGAVVVVIVIFLCCCCCRETPTSTPVTPVTPVTQVFVHEPTTNHPTRPSPYNPGKRYTSAANQQPQASHNPSPPHDVVFKRYNPPPPSNPYKPLASPAHQQPQASDTASAPSNSVVAGGGGDPSSGFATPAHFGPTHFQGSAAGGVDAPTVTLGFDCLSSDSGTRFEDPKGLNYPSAPLLSSDTPTYVYTSDKLNFNFL